MVSPHEEGYHQYISQTILSACAPESQARVEDFHDSLRFSPDPFSNPTCLVLSASSNGSRGNNWWFREASHFYGTRGDSPFQGPR